MLATPAQLGPSYTAFQPGPERGDTAAPLYKRLASPLPAGARGSPHPGELPPRREAGKQKLWWQHRLPPAGKTRNSERTHSPQLLLLPPWGPVRSRGRRRGRRLSGGEALGLGVVSTRSCGMALDQTPTFSLPVKGTTRNLLPLLHAEPWEDPHQWCLEEHQCKTLAHHLQGTPVPRPPGGPPVCDAKPPLRGGYTPLGRGSCGSGPGVVRRPHSILEITPGRHLGHTGWAKWGECDFIPPQQGVDPTSLRAQWQGHLQTADGQTHLDSKTRSGCIRRVLIRGHQQLPDTPPKQQDSSISCAPPCRPQRLRQ